MALTAGVPWSYWRAVCRVDPPAVAEPDGPARR